VVGILLAVFAVVGLDVDISSKVNLGNLGGLVCFALLLVSIILFANRGKKDAAAQ
jgi:hypothetical protein